MVATEGHSGFRPVRVSHGYYNVEPLPTPEFLSGYYAEIYYQQSSSRSYSVAYSAPELAHKRLKSAALLRSLTQWGLPRTLLDCGAGEGFLLAAAIAAISQPLVSTTRDSVWIGRILTFRVL